MTNKSAMEQLIEWLENMRVINFANEHYPYMPVLTEARRLAAEEAAEQSQTPTEEAGLREAIIKLCEPVTPKEDGSDYDQCQGISWWQNYAREALVKYPTPHETKPPGVEADGDKGLRSAVEIFIMVHHEDKKGLYADGIKYCQNLFFDVLMANPASPTKADKVESLTEIAVHKNSWIAFSGRTMGGEYRIDIETFRKKLSDESCFHSPTYAEAEAKARKFLEGLSDKEGR